MEPLTDDELRALDDHLFARETDGASSLEMLDGLLCAVAVSPEPVAEDEWLPVALGGDPDPEDAAEVAAIALMRRFAAEVATRITRLDLDDPDALDDADLPLIAMPDEDEEIDLDATEPAVGAAWAIGFAVGRDLRDDAWEALCEAWDGLADDLDEVDALFEGMEDEGEGSSLVLKERLEILAGLPLMLHELLAARLVPDTIRREEPKIGRNDLCPCGSGRKYKKCHGAG